METIKKMKGYRNFLGFTQEKMALKLRISKQSYNNKENGKTPFNDDEKTIIKELLLPYFTNITIDDIFF